MQFKQHKQITTALESPFTLSTVFVAMDRKTIRKKFRCGYKALAELQKLKLVPGKHYGADVADANGTLVAERE